MSSGLVWVKRVRSGAMTTMKSTDVARRISSVTGCRAAVGSGDSMAFAVDGDVASDSTMAVTSCRVASSLSARSSRTTAAPPMATSSVTTAS